MSVDLSPGLSDESLHVLEVVSCLSFRDRTGGGTRVLVQTAKGIGDNGIWRIAKLNGILYLPDVGSKTTSFFSAFAGISASN